MFSCSEILVLIRMEHLQEELDSLLAQLPNEQEVRDRLESLVSVYPFNEYEYIISTLLAMDVLTLDGYHELRDNYVERNPNRILFTYSPSPFGIWAQEHLQKLAPPLEKPIKKSAFDLLLDRKIRVEAKASRAVDKQSKKPLVEKALAWQSSKPFVMNFQQTKARCFDVIIWVGVWLDRFRYWVLSASELESQRRFSDRQHRGNVGEGQLHVKQDNIHEFEKYEVKPNKLEKAIRAAYDRELKAKGKSG